MANLVNYIEDDDDDVANWRLMTCSWSCWVICWNPGTHFARSTTWKTSRWRHCSRTYVVCGWCWCWVWSRLKPSEDDGLVVKWCGECARLFVFAGTRTWFGGRLWRWNFVDVVMQHFICLIGLASHFSFALATKSRSFAALLGLLLSLPGVNVVNKHWRRLWDWSFCPSVCGSVV